MKPPRLQPVWLFAPFAAAVVALAAVTGAGFTTSAQQPDQTPTPDPLTTPTPEPGLQGQTYVELLAEELNVTMEELRDAAERAWDRFIDEMVQTGRTTEQEAADLRATPRGDVLSFLVEQGDFLIRETVRAKIALIIGIDKETLQRELAEGRTIEEIANEHNVTVEQIRAELEATVDLVEDVARQTGLFTEEDIQRVRDRVEMTIDRELGDMPATPDTLPTPTPGTMP